MASLRTRRLVTLLIVAVFVAIGGYNFEVEAPIVSPDKQSTSIQVVRTKLNALAEKGRAPKTGYSREQFGGGWQSNLGCDTRNRILARDLTAIKLNDGGCVVLGGRLEDPYTGKTIKFERGSATSGDVQIDHVVALSNAWQTGAQQLNYDTRVAFYNDPLNLLAVDGRVNEEKSDGDAATWLPPNKAYRCQYVSRQVNVKARYNLWVTPAEKAAISSILARCR